MHFQTFLCLWHCMANSSPFSGKCHSFISLFIYTFSSDIFAPSPHKWHAVCQHKCCALTFICVNHPANIWMTHFSKPHRGCICCYNYPNPYDVPTSYDHLLSKDIWTSREFLQINPKMPWTGSYTSFIVSLKLWYTYI